MANTYGDCTALVQSIVDPTAGWTTTSPTGGNLLKPINAAYHFVQSKLCNRGARVQVSEVSADVAAAATSVTLSTLGLLAAYKVMEAPDGGTRDQFVEMDKVIELPYRVQTESLQEWKDEGASIVFVGATSARDLKVTGETVVTDMDGDSGDAFAIPGGCEAIAWWAARILAQARDPRFAAQCEATFNIVFEELASRFVRSAQHTVVRRRGYRR